MMKRLLFILLLCFMAGCLGHGLYAVPGENLEEMPREIALAYLMNESGKYVASHPCIYTNTGVVGYAYDELVWEQNPFGSPHIWLLVKGKGTFGAVPFENGHDDIICYTVNMNAWEGSQKDITNEEWQEAVNKIISSLESLGVEKFVEEQ